MKLDSDFILLCGHYGTGKTNFTLNLARDLRRDGQAVTVVDLDIVNPYFRSSDYKKLLDQWGVTLQTPRFARSNVDLPSLPPEIFSVLDKSQKGIVLIDAGGDDAGAKVLGRMAERIRARRYEMLYVINKYRPMTGVAKQASDLLREIEAASRLSATGIVNNSHLGVHTTAQTILDTGEFANQTSQVLGLPLVATTVPRVLIEEIKGRVENIYPVDVLVTTPWAAG